MWVDRKEEARDRGRRRGWSAGDGEGEEEAGGGCQRTSFMYRHWDKHSVKYSSIPITTKTTSTLRLDPDAFEARECPEPGERS